MKSVNKVYIPNDAPHDFSAAETFGKLVFLTEGLINRYAISTMFRVIQDALKDSKETDWIMLSSLTSFCCVLCSCFAVKHNRLNLLIHYNDAYKPKTIYFNKGHDQVAANTSIDWSEEET